MTEPNETIEASIRTKIEAAIAGAKVDVIAGSAGHYSVVVVSNAFAGKSMLESQRMVYGAIAPLMAGDRAPVHAIDSLKTRAE